jgi:uncharacterized coiled-coil protein SlyX
VEKKVQEADARVEALKAELAERERKADGIGQHCTELKEAQDKEAQLLAELTEKKCQVYSACHPHIVLLEPQTPSSSGDKGAAGH